MRLRRCVSLFEMGHHRQAQQGKAVFCPRFGNGDIKFVSCFLFQAVGNAAFSLEVVVAVSG